MNKPIRNPGWGRVLAGLLLLAWGVMPAMGQPGPPGKTASDKLVEAHQAVESADIQVRYAAYFTYTQETEFIVTHYRVRFDRASGRLRVDRPGYTLISDGKDILMVADDLPGRHLRVPLNGGLTFKRLAEVFPDLTNPIPPALVLLTAEQPLEWISSGASRAVSPLVDGQGQDPKTQRFGLAMQGASCELTCARQTLLIDQMLVDLDKQQLAGTGVEAVRFHYGFKWASVNEPIDDEVFKLDLSASQEATTLDQFLAVGGGGGGGAANGGQGGGGGGGQQAPASLVGQPLPDIELAMLGGDETVKLSELDKGVVVLEFFASWTRPSVLDLPALSKFKAWCEEKEHGVSVYAVAVGEQPEKLTRWIKALEKTAGQDLDMDVLMDTTTDAAMALRLPTIPRTIVVVDGKIVEVYGGVKPNLLDDLKKAMPGWLEQVSAADEEEDAEDEDASE